LLEDVGELNLEGIGWVIVGGESGPGARRLEKSWVVRIREQCRAANLPFFFKPWGGVRKSETGRDLDGQTYDEMPCRQPGRVVPKQQVRLALIDDVNRRERNLQPAWQQVGAPAVEVAVATFPLWGRVSGDFFRSGASFVDRKGSWHPETHPETSLTAKVPGTRRPQALSPVPGRWLLKPKAFRNRSGVVRLQGPTATRGTSGADHSGSISAMSRMSTSSPWFQGMRHQRVGQVIDCVEIRRKGRRDRLAAIRAIDRAGADIGWRE
jgi:hypothetical protein